MTGVDREDPDRAAPSREGPLDDERCLFVLALLMEGRPVEPGVEAAARAYAGTRPELAAQARAMADDRSVLAAAPAVRAPEGFTGRVLRAARPVREAPLLVLPLVRRMAVAAALVLVGTLGWSLAHPARLQADPGVERHRHAVDHFRSGPFAADDIEAGLRARLLDPEFGASGSASR